MKLLLVVDVQRGLFGKGKDAIHRGEKLLSTINLLIKKARKENALIAFVQHQQGPPLEKGSEGWLLHESLKFDRSTDIFIEKQFGSSFQETSLESLLNSRGIHELVVCGLQTEYCVDSVCRHGFALGYQISLVKDAHSTNGNGVLDAEQKIAHHNNVLKSFARIIPATEVEFKV